MSLTSYDLNHWQWNGYHEGIEWMVEVQLSDGNIHVDSGPAETEARRHESGYGRQSYESYLQQPCPWVIDFPELAEMVTKIVKMKVAKGQK